ncbi:MAG: hypothetical protein E5W56_02865 [Mesorhizobium sp.]|nr:MAG: hypothetical protein E5W56_02865 [Mesorhizobium sp.]
MFVAMEIGNSRNRRNLDRQEGYTSILRPKNEALVLSYREIPTATKYHAIGITRVKCVTPYGLSACSPQRFGLVEISDDLGSSPPSVDGFENAFQPWPGW